MDTHSLSQAEAERRAALIAVERYDIAVDLTDLPVGSEVRCVSTVTFTCGEPGAETFVDCAAQVVGATLNDVALAPPEYGRITLPNLAERNSLRVQSVQANTTTGEGVHRAVDPADGEVYVWMCFAPDEGRFVWACFDQPDLKAPHAFTVTAPREWTVTSNSGDPHIDVVESARRWRFPDTPPLSPYNTVINAGRFHEIRRDAGGHDLGIYARRSLAAVLERDADEILTLTEQGLGFFARVFGMTFPQRKYDQVFVPEFGGAMENYGCVTWSDDFLRRSTPTQSERDLLARYLLHELAHMWFGNIVTMRWWDDLWLNESFAEFASNWAATRVTSHADAWVAHLAGPKLAAYLADQGPISHPIRQPVHDVAEASAIFDAITYPKGASVLRQLMAYVGEANLSAGMTAYFARHAWGNTTLQDLIDALAKVSGRDLDRWRAAWLDTSGTDRLGLERDGDGFVLVAQGPGGQPRPQLLAVGAYRTNADGGLERVALAEVEIAQARTPVDLPPVADLYLLNDDDLTFAVTRPDPTTVNAFFTAAARLPTAISRGVAVASVWDMLVTGEATAADAARYFMAVAAVETSDSAVEPYLNRVADIAELWAPDTQRPGLAAALAATCRRLAQHPGRRQVALRALARSAADLDQVTWLQREADHDHDVDLHWRALVRKAQLGAETADEVALLLERDPDPDAWVRALTVRAATPDPAEKEAVWQRLVIDRAVPIGMVKQVTAAFWSPGQDDLLTPYAQRYLDLVPELHAGGSATGMEYTMRLFPLFGIDNAFIDRAQESAQHAAPVVHNTLLERADIARRMLHSRSKAKPVS